MRRILVQQTRGQQMLFYIVSKSTTYKAEVIKKTMQQHQRFGWCIRSCVVSCKGTILHNISMFTKRKSERSLRLHRDHTAGPLTIFRWFLKNYKIDTKHSQAKTTLHLYGIGKKKKTNAKTTHKLQPETWKLRPCNFSILPCLSVYLVQLNQTWKKGFCTFSLSICWKQSKHGHAGIPENNNLERSRLIFIFLCQRKSKFLHSNNYNADY